MHAICTIRKLKFLSRTTAKEDGVASRAFSSLVDDVESLCLVKECRELEECYKVNYTLEILTTELEDRHSVIKEMVQTIHKKTWHSSCSQPQIWNTFTESQRQWDGRNFTTCIFARNSRALYACIPGAAECDFDVWKNVLRTILCLYTRNFRGSTERE